MFSPLLQVLAQTNTNAAAALSSNPAIKRAQTSQAQTQRYLFIFETSHAMTRRAENAINVAADLIRSGLRGQMQAGDTIGIWTFNSSLNVGKFPLAKWSPETSKKISTSAGNYLAQQKFEKTADYYQVMLALNKVAENSDHLTVILITTGETDIRGTAFDPSINQSFKTWRNEQQKGRMPFVTLLRASRGKFLGYAVAPAPWQIDVPAWPAEPKLAAAAPAKTNAPIAVPQPPKPAAPTIAPSALVFSGTNPNPVLQNADANLVAALQSRLAGSTNSVTNATPAALVFTGHKPDSVAATGNSETNLVAMAAVAQTKPSPLSQHEADAPVELSAPVKLAQASSTDAAADKKPVSSGSPKAAQIPSKAQTQPAESSSSFFAKPMISRIALIAGLGSVVIGLVVMIGRRDRPAVRASLITRSFERQRK